MSSRLHICRIENGKTEIEMYTAIDLQILKHHKTVGRKIQAASYGWQYRFEVTNENEETFYVQL